MDTVEQWIELAEAREIAGDLAGACNALEEALWIENLDKVMALHSSGEWVVEYA